MVKTERVKVQFQSLANRLI